ncbi:MAG: HD domain-containing protein [Lachnospiraceae bacterium]
MEIQALLDFMTLAEKLKCNTRHSWTSTGRAESVAEHTYRLCMFAWLVKEDFPELDMERVLKMCLFHDIGEAVTGDVPSFEKGEAEQEKENKALRDIEQMLPKEEREELAWYLKEIEENETRESKLVHALDKMEAVIQHNEAPLDTWLPLEYELQCTYGQEQAEEFEYTKRLRERLLRDTKEKIEGKQW